MVNLSCVNICDLIKSEEENKKSTFIYFDFRAKRAVTLR